MDYFSSKWQLKHVVSERAKKKMSLIITLSNTIPPKVTVKLTVKLFMIARIKFKYPAIYEMGSLKAEGHTLR